MRLIAGKVMMDRHAPEGLCDTAESSYQDSKTLIEKWHGKGRNLYAITRFAPTSTPEQLAKAGQLKAEYPEVYVHTHLSENKNEVAWVKDLFPEQKRLSGRLSPLWVDGAAFGLCPLRTFGRCRELHALWRLPFAQLQTYSWAFPLKKPGKKR